MASNHRRSRIKRTNVKNGAPRGSFYGGGSRRSNEAKTASAKLKGTGKTFSSRPVMLRYRLKASGHWGCPFHKLRG